MTSKNYNFKNSEPLNKKYFWQYFFSFLFIPYGIYFFIKNKFFINRKIKFLFVIWIIISLVSGFSSNTKETSAQQLKPITINYNINEYSEETYEITSNMSNDKIEVINLIYNSLTANQAQRVKDLTNGKIKEINGGYEVYDTKNGYADKFFIINGEKSIMYYIEDNKLKNIYEHLKYSQGKSLENYNF